MAKRSSLNRKEMITEGLELQKGMTAIRMDGVNKIDHPFSYEFKKSYLVVEAKIENH